MPMYTPVMGDSETQKDRRRTPSGPEFSWSADWLPALIFLAALTLTLAGGKYFWAARVGWMLLAVLFASRIQYAILGIFFFMAFFLPSGFLPELFFTIKHYHIAIALTVLIQLLNRRLFSVIREGMKLSGPFVPIYALLGIAFAAGGFWSRNEPLRISINFALVLASLVYLTGLLSQNRRLIPEAALIFTLGVAGQAGLGIFKDFSNCQTESSGWLIHNNHLGVLCAVAFFYPFALFAAARGWVHRAVCAGLALLLFAGTVYSCSRTAWIAFACASGVFVIRGFTAYASKTKRFYLKLTLALALLGGAIAFAVTHSTLVYNRFAIFLEIFDLQRWIYSLYDFQNFGFLGIFRLQNIYHLWGVLGRHFFYGEGFTRQITDYHGLYFTVLGASGAAGLACFALFARTLLNRLTVSIREESDRETYFLKLATAAAFIAWLMSSFMETLFLQFAMWFAPVLACVLTYKAPQPPHE